MRISLIESFKKAIKHSSLATKSQSVATSTVSTNTLSIEQLEKEECFAVAGGPQVENEPEGD
ncbi:hypothetical protein [Janthinobacterium sp. HH01]|uniref:hypothetical protein n=1 Tax=Janthinobacterium sp. HH01 TaxID=1198452 RepID=UPI001268C5D4|nr:hypothetical protein [Janthinobacterium sp. HH01]